MNDNDVIFESVSPLGELLTRLWKVSFGLLKLLVFPAFMLFIFGYSIKLSGPYACIMEIVKQDSVVIEAIGEPITPGFFAWTTSYEGGFGHSTGHFYTSVSGPGGRGRIEASFQSSTLYDTLINIKFKIDDQEIERYRGSFECP